MHLLYEYHWPGNIRELKNFVEKLSVLARSPMVYADMLAEYLPQRGQMLPIVSPNLPGGESDLNEPGMGSSLGGEMGLRMLAELKRDLQDIKNVLALLLNQQGMASKNMLLPPLPVPAGMAEEEPYRPNTAPYTLQSVRPAASYYPDEGEIGFSTPPVQPAPASRRDAPLLEESLSLERKEKDMIKRALVKHGQNRKKAADELGISERTLYRKLKSYELD